MLGPGADEFHLLQRFRRVEMVATLGNPSPPRRELPQRFFACLPLSDEVTAHRCTCPSDSAPAVQVNFASFLKVQVNSIENGIHFFRSRQTKIPNGKAQVSCLYLIKFDF